MRFKKKVILIFTIASCFALSLIIILINFFPVNIIWYSEVNGPESSNMVIDSNNNIYSVGNGNENIFLIKLNSDGNKLWDCEWGGLNFDFATAVALDSLNNIYVTGITESYGAGNRDICLIKYNDNGVELWSRIWGGSNNDEAHSIAIDSSGNIYLVGNTESYGAGGIDMFLIKFDNNGIQLWNQTWGSSVSDGCRAIGIDSSNNIYIAGWTDIFGGADIALVKYNTDGIQLWNSTWKGYDADECRAITIDSSGNIYLGGNTASYGAGDRDMCLIKYNHEGIQLWNRTWGGADWDEAHSIAMDSSNNIYIAGFTMSYGAGDRDVCLVKFDNQGNLIFSYTQGGPSDDECHAVRLDSSQNIYLSGRTLIQGNPELLFLKLHDNTILYRTSLVIVIIVSSIAFPLFFTFFIYPPIKFKIREKKIAKIKTTVLTMKNKYTRLKIIEISDECGVKRENLIIGTIENMIKNDEVNGQYFSTTKSLAFDQRVFIDKSDKPIEIYEVFEKDDLGKSSRIKKTILSMSTKYDRLQISEIAEESSIIDEGLIIETIKEMIGNKEVYAQYFSSTKTVAFNQQTNIDEIDRLMKIFKEWEEEIGKKKI